MDRRPLGRTGLTVPIVCLGTMTYGQQNTEADGHAQMDRALDAGVDFFDTAELYSIPPLAETTGSTERIIGSWFKARGNRSRVTLATKIVGRSPMPWFRPDGQGTRITPDQIDIAVEQSLKRLQTDYIDLYQMHWPDRRVNLFGGFAFKHFQDEFTPFEVILEALGRHVEKGNIRHIGVSNETSWGVMRFVAEAQRRGLPRIASIQNAYHLLNRTFEAGLAEIAHQEDVGLLAYSPLAQGYLTGKYLDGARPAGARTTLFNRGQRYETPAADRMIRAYLMLARDHGLTPEQLALKFCATRSFMTSVIIGATTMDQLEADLAAFQAPWTKALEDAVDELHASCPNPCP
jgi:aryl-alcohol dehydrogenase-like predicted oxidoreductase